MPARAIKIASYLLLLLVAISCRQKFEPPAIKTDYRFLVVEGIINTNANERSTFMLTRTRRLNDTTTFVPEKRAFFVIHSSSGSSFALDEISPGIYTTGQLNLNKTDKYRVSITTTDNIQYESDFTIPKTSPAIDSLTWEQKDDVGIFVYSHDDSGQSKYYQWEYTETWQYTSKLETAWGVKNGLAYVRDPLTEQVHNCWIDSNSTNIQVGTSVRLSEDRISGRQIATIKEGSEKLLIRYSILVRQYALTKEAYEYWHLIQKNSQELGTLFDAQPTQLTGNIRCLTNPSEPVIGFISAGSPQEKRIFIDKSQVTGWYSNAPSPECYEAEITQDPNNFLIFNYPDPTFGIYYFVTPGIIKIAKNECLDCTLKGGKNIKPGYW